MIQFTTATLPEHEQGQAWRDGTHYEFDIVAGNGDEAVVVEVKTTLKSEQVTEFLEKLQRFYAGLTPSTKSQVSLQAISGDRHRFTSVNRSKSLSKVATKSPVAAARAAR